MGAEVEEGDDVGAGDGAVSFPLDTMAVALVGLITSFEETAQILLTVTVYCSPTFCDGVVTMTEEPDTCMPRTARECPASSTIVKQENGSCLSKETGSVKSSSRELGESDLAARRRSIEFCEADDAEAGPEEMSTNASLPNVVLSSPVLETATTLT